MNKQYIRNGDNYTCTTCQKSYKSRQGAYDHCQKMHKQPIKIKVVSKNSSDKSAAIHDVVEKMEHMMEHMMEHIAKLSTNPTNVTNNVTHNTINIYFNKDLKYYPELVKMIGVDGARDLLLFKMPENKDYLCVMDKLFARGGINGCPIQMDGDEFVIFRGKSEVVHDPTGEIIMEENKQKLQDAVLSAYVDSTKQISRACDDIRINRINSEYSEADSETLNCRFSADIEPSRPYEVMDAIGKSKLHKKDYDRLRKMCPVVVKKIIT